MKRKPIFTLVLSVLLVVAVLVGGTLAYLQASTKALVNSFSLADVRTEIEEDPTGTETTKRPTVKNVGESEVYVRARAVVVTGENSSVPVSEADVYIRYNIENYVNGSDAWVNNPATYWTYGNDGWYYYNAALEKNQSTEPLFDGVQVVTEWDKPEDVKFDIYVYHESVLATKTSNGPEAFE